MQGFRRRFLFGFDATEYNKESEDEEKQDFGADVSFHNFNEILKGGVLFEKLVQRDGVQK